MCAASLADLPATSSGWPAQLTLRFERDGAVTRMRRGRSFGPVYVQKPFFPEPNGTHVYIVHPPGGLVGGDTLSIDVTVEHDAHALLTTPAATKVYRVAAAPVTLVQRLTVRRNGLLEWLPLETIAFARTKFVSRTEIVLEPGAQCFAWEMTAFGRPAGDRPFVAGDVEQRTTIFEQDGEHKTPLLIERNRLVGGSPRQQARWGYAGRTVSASAWFAPADRALGNALVDALGDDAAALSVSVPDRVLTLRTLDDDAERCMRRLRKAWAIVRELALERAPCPPRIWTT
ncbi:MAG: urease accessory protein UreD [Pseudomonadota bacterium]